MLQQQPQDRVFISTLANTLPGFSSLVPLNHLPLLTKIEWIELNVPVGCQSDTTLFSWLTHAVVWIGLMFIFRIMHLESTKSAKKRK